MEGWNSDRAEDVGGGLEEELGEELPAVGGRVVLEEVVLAVEAWELELGACAEAAAFLFGFFE